MRKMSIQLFFPTGGGETIIFILILIIIKCNFNKIINAILKLVNITSGNFRKLQIFNKNAVVLQCLQGPSSVLIRT